MKIHQKVINLTQHIHHTYETQFLVPCKSRRFLLANQITCTFVVEHGTGNGFFIL